MNVITRFLNLLSYPRAVLMSAWAVVDTVVMSSIVVILALSTGSKRMMTICIAIWSNALLWPSGARVELRGRENVRASGRGFLLLFNHSSLWDIPVLFAKFPRNFMYGAKVELFKIPFFAQAMRVCGVLPIDRGNRNKVMKIYEQAHSRVEAGECFALAPEGTRQDSAQLGKFKRGPFEFAINAKMDIQPVIVAGALRVIPKHSLLINAGRWRRRVIVEVLPPVSTAEFTIETVDALMERVRSVMDSSFIRLNRELDHHPG